MITKHELKQCRFLRFEIAAIETEINDLRNSGAAAQVAVFARKQAGAVTKPTESAAVKILRLTEKLERKRQKWLDLLAKAENEIDCLGDRERVVIREYYLNGRSWFKVCEITHYAPRQVYRYNTTALKRLIAENQICDSREP